MKAHEFSSCADAVKFEIIKAAGICLMTCRTDQHLIYLFAVDGFYVEVVQEAKSGKLWTLRSFDDMDNLEPFLSRIDISTVLNQ